MKLWMLGSGSGGNAILVDCGGSRVLIDCGFGTRTLAARLRMIGVAPESIDGCLITHEHSDHVKGAGAAAKRWGWGIYATPGTARARELADVTVHGIDPSTPIEFPQMSVTATATPHDANDPVGFVVTSRATGARAGLFYDLGHVSRAIADACDSLDILILESNHDTEMLRTGPYPRWLQSRISCSTGHLSNRDAGLFARDAASRGLSHLVLAHLSEQCNAPEVALASMRAALGRSRFRGTLTAASQNDVAGPFMSRPARATPSLQYTFF